MATACLLSFENLFEKLSDKRYVVVDRLYLVAAAVQQVSADDSVFIDRDMNNDKDHRISDNILHS